MLFYREFVSNHLSELKSCATLRPFLSSTFSQHYCLIFHQLVLMVSISLQNVFNFYLLILLTPFYVQLDLSFEDQFLKFKVKTKSIMLV